MANVCVCVCLSVCSIASAHYACDFKADPYSLHHISASFSLGVNVFVYFHAHLYESLLPLFLESFLTLGLAAGWSSASVDILNPYSFTVQLGGCDWLI